MTVILFEYLQKCLVIVRMNKSQFNVSRFLNLLGFLSA